MPATLWKAFGTPDPNSDYLALLSYLPLKRYRTIPRFVGYSRHIQTQLGEARGLNGYSLRTNLLKCDFWTLSVWEREAALMEFIHKGFHSGVMVVLRP